MNWGIKTLSGFLLLMATGCATYPPSKVPGVKSYTDSQYHSLFTKNAQTISRYKGLTNTMTATAVPLTADLVEVILARKAQIYQWDATEYETQRTEMLADLAKSTQFFFSLYTPESRMDDINRKKDLWRLYLNAGGERYEGEAQRLHGKTHELNPIYPSLDRFSKAYILSFPLSTNSLPKSFQLHVTGPVDSATFEFK